MNPQARAGAAAALLLAALTVPRWAAGQQPPASSRPATSSRPASSSSPSSPAKTAGFWTSEEAELLGLVRSEKFLTVRSKAEQMLEKYPDSVVAHYALGLAFREAEGALPQAMWHLERATERYEARHAPGPRPDAPWQLHQDLLYGLQATALLLDDSERQLAILDRYDQFYTPKMLAHRGWPLMKLGRFAEARLTMHRALAESETRFHGRALNSLCAIESESHEREAAYQACNEVLAFGRKRIADGYVNVALAVYANNASLAALGVLRHDEAERVALEGTRHPDGSGSNPWRHLVALYVSAGRIPEAIGAAREMQSWRARQPPDMRDQHRADVDAALALLFLAAGDPESGLVLADRALDRPDRRGMISSKPEQALGLHALLRRALRIQRSEELSELGASAPSWRARLSLLLAAARERWLASEDEERVAQILVDEKMLDATLRPYLDGGLSGPAMLAPDLAETLGPAVAAASLARARAADPGPAFTPYFDAIGAGIARLRGRHDEALALARSALAALPPAETLLAGRAAAIGASAALARGSLADAIPLLLRALALDPGALRHFGLALPVRLQVSGAPAQEAAALLARSPRFSEDSLSDLILSIAPRGGQLEGCLRGPDGAAVACADVPLDAEAPAALARAFHRALLSPRASLAGLDLRSLDGSTTVESLERDKLRILLQPPAPHP
jgi:hypothetical protein